MLTPGIVARPVISADPVTWDPANKSNSLTLSGANLTLTIGAGAFGHYYSARATLSRNSGKFYYELVIDGFTGIAGFIKGLGTAAANLENYPGAADAYGWGWYEHPNGTSFVAHSGVNANYAFGDAGVIGVMANLDDGELRYSLNGVDKGAATTPPLTGSLFPMAAIQVDTPASNCTGRFTRADMQFIPAGYLAWDGT